VSGSILHNDPALDVATYIQQLTDERLRLSQLRDPDDAQLDVEASLLSSYAQLDAPSQQVFRQLGVLIADFTATLAQAVVMAPLELDVEAILRSLLRRNLLMYDAARGRWRMHDLTRALALGYLEQASEHEAAMWRYAREAVQIARETEAQYLTGAEDVLAALTRFDAERPHIDAARRWSATQAGTLAGDQLLIDAAQATRYIEKLRYDQQHEILPLWQGVRAAARRLGDRLQEVRALGNLGNAYYRIGETYTAISYHEQALTAYRELGDRRGEGVTLNNLGIAYYRLGEFPKAISYYEQALATDRELGNRQSEGVALGNLGNAYRALGNLPRAIACCEEACSIARAIGDRRDEGYALSYLAHTQARQGDRAYATRIFEQAVTLLQEVGDLRGVAACQWEFGLELARQGGQEKALPLLRAAVAYEQEMGYAKAAEHTTLLARLEAGEERGADQRAVGADVPLDDGQR
jgi:tetratricopeptide (TPR) repeat protein